MGRCLALLPSDPFLAYLTLQESIFYFRSRFSNCLSLHREHCCGTAAGARQRDKPSTVPPCSLDVFVCRDRDRDGRTERFDAAQKLCHGVSKEGPGDSVSARECHGRERATATAATTAGTTGNPRCYLVGGFDAEASATNSIRVETSFVGIQC